MLRDDRDDDIGPIGKVCDLGRYRLIAELARGGMGIVYLALVRGPAGFHKLFVIKELMAHLADDPAYVAMFLDEARLAARLHHPNIVQTLEVGDAEGRPFLAMEYLEGQTLHRVLQRSARRGAAVPLAMHLAILTRVLDALDYAHALVDCDGAPLGVVHRDASPHNVFVTYEGEVKLLDFGIAKVADASHETRTGVLKGKVSYMAPEQARGEAVDRRADLFALGVMLWEALAGRRLWKGTNDLAVLHERLRAPVEPPSAHAAGVPEGLERVAMKALATDPDARFATAASMRAAIDAYVASSNVPAVPPRALGAFVAELFDDERTRIRRIVDAQLRTLRGTATTELAAVDLVRLPAASMPESGTPPVRARVSSSPTTLRTPPTHPTPSSIEPSAAILPPRSARAASRLAWFGGAALVAAIGVALAVTSAVRPTVAQHDAESAPAPVLAATANEPPPLPAASPETAPPETRAPDRTASSPPPPPFVTSMPPSRRPAALAWHPAPLAAPLDAGMPSVVVREPAPSKPHREIETHDPYASSQAP